MRYELTDYEWAAVRPFLPNKPRGVPRVNDRRVLNGIFWILRSGAPWRENKCDRRGLDISSLSLSNPRSIENYLAAERADQLERCLCTATLPSRFA
jgi:hypothetical protein